MVIQSIGFAQDTFEMAAQELTKTMVKSLDLSTEQEKKIYKINLKFYKDLEAAKKEKDDVKKVLALKAIAEEREQKVDAILTKEQLKKVKTHKVIRQ